MKRLANLILLLVASFSTVFAITPAEEYSNSRMLVVCHEKFENSMKPFVLHKNELGMTTEMIVVKDVEDHLALKSIIEAYTKQHPDVAYLLLVGDTDYMPHYYLRAKGVSGPGDHYFDSYIKDCSFRTGRFSGESVEDIDAMVTRSILYDHISKDQSWCRTTLTIGSNNESTDIYGNIADYEFAQNLGKDFEKVGLKSIVLFDKDSVDLMDKTNVVKTINNGCSLVNYTGHGEPRMWVTSEFTYDDAMRLNNRNQWPIIFSTACVVGDFSDTCLAEGFLRSRDADGYPTGAVAMLASGSNQPLSFPMAAQSCFNHHWLKSEEVTFGKLCKLATDSMYTYDPVAESTYLTWNLFGDPSQLIFPYNNEIIPSELTVSTRIKGGKFDFNAEDQLTASNSITYDANVEFRAKSVVLKDGFHFSGDYFLASNDSKVDESDWYAPNNAGSGQSTDVEGIVETIPEIAIYPIPTDGEFTVDFNGIAGDKRIMIYDIQGHLVYQNSSDQPKIVVDLAAYDKGVYNIRIMTDFVSMVRQILVK